MTVISQVPTHDSLGPSPPDPGVWGRCVLRALVLAALLCASIPGRGPIERLAAVALAGCAGLAVELVQTRRCYAPLRNGLLAMTAIDAVNAALRWAVLTGGPYAEVRRAVFHIHEALVLAAFAVLPLVAASPPVDGRRWRLVRFCVIAGALGMLAHLIFGYSTVRPLPLDDRAEWLRLRYLIADVGAVGAAWLALWWGRKAVFPTTWQLARQVIACLVAGDLALLVVGAWWSGLFGAAYLTQQAGLCALYLVVAVVQARALLRDGRART